MEEYATFGEMRRMSGTALAACVPIDGVAGVSSGPFGLGRALVMRAGGTHVCHNIRLPAGPGRVLASDSPGDTRVKPHFPPGTIVFHVRERWAKELVAHLGLGGQR